MKIHVQSLHKNRLFAGWVNQVPIYQNIDKKRRGVIKSQIFTI
jgi:hypothetical protein